MPHPDMIAKRKANTQHMRNYRARKKLWGFCVYGGCWRPARDNVYCPLHREQRNARDRERRAKK